MWAMRPSFFDAARPYRSPSLSSPAAGLGLAERLRGGSPRGDAPAWKCVQTMDDHAGTVWALAYANGELFSGAEDHCVKVWDPATWRCKRTLSLRLAYDRVTSLLVCGGHLIAGLSSGGASSWELGDVLTADWGAATRPSLGDSEEGETGVV